MIDNLKYCRQILNKTQREIGDELNVSYQTISNWENGHDTIPLEKLIKFCNIHSYSLDYVCGLSSLNNPYKKINIDKVKIGNKLRRIRIDAGLTQSEIADECSITQAMYSLYEKGKYLVNTITLYTICKNHNVSMDYVLS